MIEGQIFDMGVILASSSPRRAEILDRIGMRYRIVASGAEEITSQDLLPAEVAVGNAKAKAESVAHVISGHEVVIGCDSIVVLDGDIFGKPKDANDAKRMLNALSGRTHQVISGVCITDGDSERTFFQTTDVTFKELDKDTIDAYIRTDEPRDKAGAYGIQGIGMLLVDHIDGDYENVVGLPASHLIDELDAFCNGTTRRTETDR